MHQDAEKLWNSAGVMDLMEHQLHLKKREVIFVTTQVYASVSKLRFVAFRCALMASPEVCSTKNES